MTTQGTSDRSDRVGRRSHVVRHAMESTKTRETYVVFTRERTSRRVDTEHLIVTNGTLRNLIHVRCGAFTQATYRTVRTVRIVSVPERVSFACRTQTNAVDHEKHFASIFVRDTSERPVRLGPLVFGCVISCLNVLSRLPDTKPNAVRIDMVHTCREIGRAHV